MEPAELLQGRARAVPQGTRGFKFDRNTRSSMSGKFYVKSSRLEIQNNSFSRLGVKLWNETPRYITDLPKKTFKKVLCKLLFDVLEKEDDYIQIPMIIKKVGK